MAQRVWYSNPSLVCAGTDVRRRSESPVMRHHHLHNEWRSTVGLAKWRDIRNVVVVGNELAAPVRHKTNLVRESSSRWYCGGPGS